MYSYRKYLGQKYFCCQLISALNARIFFGLDVPELDSERFETLVDLSYCRNGAAINIAAAWKELEISAFRFSPHMERIKSMLSLGFPVELSVFRKWSGFHSILLVGFDSKYFGAANWSEYETLSLISSEELETSMPSRYNVNRSAKLFTRPCGGRVYAAGLKPAGIYPV